MASQFEVQLSDAASYRPPILGTPQAPWFPLLSSLSDSKLPAFPVAQYLAFRSFFCVLFFRKLI